jgi:two-component system OmpR family sensor kinase
MTLRLRLVLALVALSAAGLVVFGAATYTAYARSQYERLDQQLRSSVPIATIELEGALLGEIPERPSPPDGGPVTVTPGTYAELRSEDGTVLATVQVSSSSDAVPDIPDDIEVPSGPSTVGTESGSGEWRVVAERASRLPGTYVVVAVPTDDVVSSLRRLLVIELLAGAVLLAVLAAGSWLILRRGLRPLEHMAVQARGITAGDLSERVEPADGRSEVGQLGLALNTMLGEIEEAFNERDETERRLRQFLADASHELRTPLTSIQGFAELFRLRTEQGDADPAVMSRIEEEAARMRVLVEDLLLLARLDQTRPPELGPVDLAIVCADACTGAAAFAPGRRLTLDAPDPVVVTGDLEHLRQAIGNLVTNAVRHTPDDASIDVSVRVVGEDAVVTVRDTGPGLDADALEHVFDRFWQADRARVGSGAGLGLSIVAAIAAEHGGSAAAVNHPGGGAVFTFRMPRAGVTPPRPEKPAASAAPVPMTPDTPVPPVPSRRA